MAWIRCTGNTGGSLKVRTASGAIASFETNIADVLQSVKCEINATGGNGTPDNPIPINGYTEANITRCGVNIWDEVWETGSINDDGTLDDSSWATTNRIRSTNYTLVTPDTSYYFVWTSEQTNAVRIYFYDVNKTFISYYQINFSSSKTFTTPSNCKYIKWRSAGSNSIVTSNNDISINYPATDTTYHAYNGHTYTIDFGQTVYGGQLIILPDRTYFHATHGIVDLGDLTWYPSYCALENKHTMRSDGIDNLVSAPHTSSVIVDILCPVYPTKTGDETYLGTKGISILKSGTIAVFDERYSSADSANAFKSAMTGVKLVYPLATPFDIDLTPEQIEALLGVNNVWHDANGDTEVKFLEVVRN